MHTHPSESFALPRAAVPWLPQAGPRPQEGTEGSSPSCGVGVLGAHRFRPSLAKGSLRVCVGHRCSLALAGGLRPDSYAGLCHVQDYALLLGEQETRKEDGMAWIKEGFPEE